MHSQKPESLIDRLEQDYVQHTQASAAEEISALRELLGEPLPQSTSVHERPPILLSLGIVLLVALAVWLFRSNGLQAATIVVAALAGGGIYMLVSLFTRLNNALFTLSLEGVRFRGTSSVVPWSAIADFSVTQNSVNGIDTGVAVAFDLEEGYQPEWPRKQPVRVKYRRKKNKIGVSVLALRPSSKKIAKAIGEYRTQSLVRARLAELGAEV